MRLPATLSPPCVARKFVITGVQTRRAVKVRAKQTTADLCIYKINNAELLSIQEIAFHSFTITHKAVRHDVSLGGIDGFRI